MGSAPVSGVGLKAWPSFRVRCSGVSPKRIFNCLMKPQTGVLKPIPEKDMPKWARAASQAHRRATRKKRAELRRRGLPMIIWKDGSVREVPA
jgi:hypothetical protein